MLIKVLFESQSDFQPRFPLRPFDSHNSGLHVSLTVNLLNTILGYIQDLSWGRGEGISDYLRGFHYYTGPSCSMPN